jgi:hypothetical protein
MKKKSKKMSIIKRKINLTNVPYIKLLIVILIAIVLFFGAINIIKTSNSNLDNLTYELKSIKIEDYEILRGSNPVYYVRILDSLSVSDIHLDYKGYTNHEIHNQNGEKGIDLTFEKGDKIYIQLFKKDEIADTHVIEVTDFSDTFKYFNFIDECPISSLGELKETKENYCSRDIKINGKSYLLEASLNGNTRIVKREDYLNETVIQYEFEIRLNKIPLFKDYLGYGSGFTSFQIINDAVFFTAIQKAASFNDFSKKNYIIGVEPESRLFLNIENPDKELKRVNIIFDEEPFIKIEGRKIILKGSRMDSSYYLEDFGKYLCKVPRDAIIDADYSFNYLGNGAISSISRTNFRTAEQIIKNYEDGDDEIYKDICYFIDEYYENYNHPN